MMSKLLYAVGGRAHPVDRKREDVPPKGGDPAANVHLAEVPEIVPINIDMYDWKHESCIDGTDGMYV